MIIHAGKREEEEEEENSQSTRLLTPVLLKLLVNRDKHGMFIHSSFQVNGVSIVCGVTCLWKATCWRWPATAAACGPELP